MWFRPDVQALQPGRGIITQRCIQDQELKEFEANDEYLKGRFNFGGVMNTGALCGMKEICCLFGCVLFCVFLRSMFFLCIFDSVYSFKKH